MAAKKKQQRNGFYFFMQDIIPDLKKQGYVFPNGMADVVPVAHPRWKALEPKDKERYEKKVKEWKMQENKSLYHKFDCRGNPLSLIRKEQQERERKYNAMLQEISSTINSLNSTNDLPKGKFFVVSFNITIKTDEEENPTYWPCEVALVRFSLINGVDKVLQIFISPGELPKGYSAQAIETSNLMHKIPHKGFELAEDNYPGFIIRMKNFLNPSEESPRYPPVYCMANEFEQTESCFEWMLDRAGERREDMFRVFTLGHLFVELAKKGNKNVTLAECTSNLEKSTFDYHDNIACLWHEDIDEPKWCALGMAKRRAFIICDELCPAFGIELKGDAHVPITPISSSTQTHLNLSRSTVPEIRSSSQPDSRSNEVITRHNRQTRPAQTTSLSQDTSSDSEVFSQPRSISSQPLRRPTTTGFTYPARGFQPPPMTDDNFQTLGGGNHGGILNIYAGRGLGIGRGIGQPTEQRNPQPAQFASIGRGRPQVDQMAIGRGRGVGGSLAAQFNDMNLGS